MPDFSEGQIFDGAEIAVSEHFTQPPKPYTEDTLLSAMENAGKEDIRSLPPLSRATLTR